MVVRPSVLCPTDFSEPSRGALKYAAAIAEHFHAALSILTVDDPMLRTAADTAYGKEWLPAHTTQALEDFVKQTFHYHRPSVAEVNLDVTAGKPADEILRDATTRHVDLIVMSTHGLTGPKKLLFGSTSEAVLRRSTVPVLVVPASDPGPDTLEDVMLHVRTVLAPVDFTAATERQVQVARGLAAAVGASVALAHVLAPLHGRVEFEALMADMENARRVESRRRLAELHTGIPVEVRADMILAAGDPATEIARIARQLSAGVIVMGLHSSIGGGPRMGSITYRVLCQAACPVLALPPAPVGTSRRVDFTRQPTLADA